MSNENLEKLENMENMESMKDAKNTENTENEGTVGAVEKAAKEAEAVEIEGTACEECTQKMKERTGKEYRDMINRLSRIEGQIRGIKGMVEKDVYCTDILVQVAAVNAALNSFNRVLLANHIKTCVTKDIRDGREETVDELIQTLKKLMK